MPGLRMAKADQDDFDTTNKFLQACEMFWDNRDRYSFKDMEADWMRWDDEDEDKIELLKIRKDIAEEERLSEVDVDNRLILFEFLKRRYHKADTNWRRAIFCGQILIDNFCDPQETHLACSPYLEEFHVAPEQ